MAYDPPDIFSPSSMEFQVSIPITVVNQNRNQHTLSPLRFEIIFIDADVEHHEQLMAALWAQGDAHRHFEVHVLDGGRDGIGQIGEVLATYQNLNAVHVISHGTDGGVKLGNVWLYPENLDRHAAKVFKWRESLAAGADLLLYGCNLASTPDGQRLVRSLGALTGSDVAASVNYTGLAQLGGDWNLEYQTGLIETSVAFGIWVQETWSSVLATVTVDTTDDTINGDTTSITTLIGTPGIDGISLREAIIATNNTPGADQINLAAETYSLSIFGVEDFALQGDFDIRDDLTIVGVSESATSIEVTTSSRIFEVHNDTAITVMISNLKLEGATTSFGLHGGVIRIKGDVPLPDVTLSNVWLTNNSAGGSSDGGAIYNEGRLTVTDSLIDTNNTDSNGGAIYNHANGDITLINVTLSGNTAIAANGGGLYNDGIATLQNVTITANSANQGGGIYDSGPSADTGMTNTIVADNTAPTGPDVSGDLSSSGSNIFGDKSGGSGFDPSDLETDPLLGPSQNNGGLTFTHALLDGSPAIDAGLAAGAPLVDQRGVDRDTMPDIGAYEVQVAAELWLSTDDDVPSPSGVPGLDSWGRDDVLSFGSPNFNLEPGTTNGTLAPVLNLDNFAQDSDATIKGMHYVGRDTTVGGDVFPAIDLFRGDLLLIVDANETLDGTGANLLSVTSHDVFVFRPDAAGVYSAGTFLLLLQDPAGDPLLSISLLESSTWVGDVTLAAGTFIYSKANSGSDLLYHFTADDVGSNTSGTLSVLLTLSEVDINQRVSGLDLVEHSVMIGDTTIQAGDLLVTLEGDDSSVGTTSPISTKQQDIFYLDVAATTMGSGTASATATLLLEGLDVGLNTDPEDLHALTLLAPPVNPPVVSLSGGSTPYIDGDPPTVIDALATVDDPDASGFDGGTLVVDIISGGTVNDRLGIRDQGPGVGNISVFGSDIRYDFGSGPVVIGTFSGGGGVGDPLIVVLNANADQTAVQALLQNVTYENVAVIPSEADRIVEFVLTDGGGNTSLPATQTIDFDTTATLWLNAKDHTDPSDTNLPAWKHGDVVGFGIGATFGETTTSGDFSQIFALFLDDTSQADLRAIHYVSRPLTLGNSPNTFDVQPGDLIAALDAGGTLLSSNSLTVTRQDVFVFRPDIPGHYTSGTFTMLLEDPVSANIHAITLVEEDVDFADGTSLSAGTFLLSHSGPHEFVYTYQASGVGGDGATTGSEQPFLNGNTLGFSNQVQGLELLEVETTVGDTTIPATRLLISVDGNTTVAGQAVTPQDIVYLHVTGTELMTSTAATATMLLDGHNVALADNSETFDGLTLSSVTVPTANDDGYAVDEDDTLTVDAAAGILVNDTDPETDPLSARQMSGTANGALTLNPTSLINETNLTNDIATDKLAAWSPDDSKVAFQTNRDGNFEIYVMDADGSNPTNLTSHSADDTGPSWSPDGSQIAFSTNRDGNTEIYVMDADGLNPVNLTINPAGDSRPDWSPDGSQIVFRSDRDGNAEIYVMGANGSNQTRLTNHPTNDTAPVWSPDGSQIAFRTDRDGDDEIYVMDAGGTNPTNVTNHGAQDGSPDWSPDGSKIVFRSDRDGNDELYAMDANGSNLTRLTDNTVDDTGPAWSPDGSQMIFKTNRDGNDELYVATILSDGAFSYTPDVDFHGVDSFAYVATDGTFDSNIATVTITVNPTADTPSVTHASTLEDNQTTAGLVISRNPVDGSEVTHFKITAITGGTLYQANGMTVISDDDFITFSEGNAGLKFTPSPHSTSPGSFTVQASTVANDSGLGGSTVDATITVTPVGDTPQVSNVVTLEDTQSGPIVLNSHASDGPEVTHFRISNIIGGTLYHNDGSTVINAGTYITVSEGTAGLKFTPSPNSTTTGSFDVESSEDGLTVAAQSGTATATITITPVGDTPSVTNSSTLEDTQTTSGLVLSRHASDGPEVTHFRISSIAGGTLYHNDGSTVISAGTYITVAEGASGLKFTPSAHSTTAGSFDLASSEDGATVAAQSGTATATISITPVGDTPSVTHASTLVDTQTTSGLVLSRHIADGPEVTHFRISNITNGTLYHNDGSTVIPSGTYITVAQGSAGLKFTPLPSSTATGLFEVASSEDGVTVSSQSGVATATITVITAMAGPLLLTTNNHVTAGGQSGVDTWRKADLIQIDDPNLAFEPSTTNGTFSVAASLDVFVSGKNINAIHYVSKDIQVGASAFPLYAGDLLLASKDASAFGALSVSGQDVVVFRPDTPGDYSAGTFTMLLENPVGAEIRGISLIEQNTPVGDANLEAGDFLFTRSGGAEDSSVWLFETTDVGAASTSGTASVLLEGGDVGISIDKQLFGVDLVETTTLIGTRTLNAGTLLLAIDSGDTVGSNNLAVLKHDIFALEVSKTTLVSGAGNGLATASLFFEGGEVAFESGDEELDGLTLTVMNNSAPTATNLSAAEAYTEDTPLNLTDIVITDPDSASVTATLTLSDTAAGSLSTGTSGSVTSTYNAGTGVWIASGALTDVNTLLAGVTYTPTSNYNSSFTIASSVDDGIASPDTGLKDMTGTAVGDTPSVTNASTLEDTQTTSGLVISRHATDGAEVTHFRLSNIVGGSLYHSDGSTVIASGTYITVAQGSAGLKFTPSPNSTASGSFDVESSEDGASVAAQSGVATATITVTPVGDMPSVTNASTLEDTQTTSGLVISRHGSDGGEVTHFRVSTIVGGTLYQSDGSTVIPSGTYITVAQGGAGLKFTPNAHSTSLGSFDVESSEDGTSVAAQSGVATATITVTPVGDTPSVTNTSTAEDTQTTSGLVISRHAADGAEVTHFRLSNITGGTLYHNDGSTVIASGTYITVAQGATGLKFTPSPNSTASGSFDVESSEDGATVAAQSGVATATITVTPVGDTPSVTNASTTEDTQTTSGLVISRHVTDGAEVTHFRISNVTGGTLYHNDGLTVISSGDYITFAQGQAGLKFTPSPNSTTTGSFDVESSEDGLTVATQSGTATATITVTPAGDTPTVTNASTLEDTQTTSGLVISRHAADGPEVMHFRISTITGGTLYQNDGLTVIPSGTYITFAEGSAGLKFTPSPNSTAAGSFNVESSEDGTTVSAQSGTATATITVTPVGDTPSVTNAGTLEDTQTTSGLVISPHAADGSEVTHFRISTITGGTLYQNDGLTVISSGAYITLTQGQAGLKFTPSLNSTTNGSFDVESSEDGATVSIQSGVATATITLTPVGDTPSVTHASTLEDAQTTAGLVISRHASDGAEVTHFRISNVVGGTLYHNDGSTVIPSGTYIDFSQANAGLKFTPSLDSIAVGGFDVESSQTGTSVAAQSGVATATITITPVNDAPVLDNTGTMVLTDVIQDNANPPGNSVASVLSSAGGDRITDVDIDPVEGIAVIGVDDANGTWEYSTDGGAVWSSFVANGVANGFTDDTSAILLDEMELIRFVPDPGYTGPADDLTFHAWDQTSGASGDTGVDISVQGGTSAYSLDTETATLSVVAVSGVTNFVPGAQSLDEDDSLPFSTGNGNLIVVDDGSGADLVLRTSLSVTSGTLTLATTAGLTFESGADGTSAMTISGPESAINTALDGLSYNPGSDYYGSETLEVTTDSSVGLLAHYSFDNVADPGNDDSPSGANDGTVNGGAVPLFDAMRGSNVLQFDGTDDFVYISGLLGSPAHVTLAAWVKMDAGFSDNELISIGNNVAIQLDETLSGYGVYGSFYDGATWQPTISSTSIASTGWHHIAYTVNTTSNTQVLYIDGTPVATDNHIGTIVYGSGTDTYIGRHGLSATNFLHGKVDDVRLYDRALTAVEVSSLVAGETSDTDTVSITVEPVGDTPSVTNASTLEDIQSTSGLVISRHAADGSEVSHFHISTITGGTLYHNDGLTVISSGDYITFAQGQAGLKFTPSPHSTTTGSFDVESSEDGLTVAAQSGTATATITVTPAGDTPTVTNASTLEDTQTTSGLVISRHAADGPEVTHFRISTITGGTLYHTDGSTVIPSGTYITFAQGQAGLKFTPSPNSTSTGSFDVEASEDGLTVSAQSGVAIATITVTPAGDTPTITNANTLEDTQTTLGLVISRHASDGSEVTHFRISNITGGTLYHNDGLTVISSGDYITFAQGQAGLKFTPSPNSTADGSFDVESSENGATVAVQSGVATATITVKSVGDTPQVDSVATLEDMQSGPIVVSRHASDGPEVTHFKMTNIVGGTLFHSDGVTVINHNDFITVTQGSAGLKFTPSPDSNTPGSFNVESSEDGLTVAAQSGAATSMMTITPVGDTPQVASMTTDEDTQSAAIVLNRHVADGAEVTHFRISNITGGTLYHNDGVTAINAGVYIPVADGNAGLKFTPSPNMTTPGQFDVESSEDGFTVAAQSGIATSAITVTPIGDTPRAESVATLQDQQSGPIVLDRHLDDGAEVTHFRISNISGGTLYQDDGVTVINSGDFVTVAQGQSGLTFTPTIGSTSPGSFDVEASENGSTVATQSDIATAMITITTTSGLWLSTEEDVPSPSGAPGLDSWGQDDILVFDDPSIGLEPGITTGTLSPILNLDSFAQDGDADIKGAHYVSRDLSVGGTFFPAINLLAGDLVLVVDSSETFNGTGANLLSVTNQDVFIFRPDFAGDYSAGTFLLLLQAPSGDPIQSISLIENATLIGDVILDDGSFIFTQSNNDDDAIYHFTAEDAGTNTFGTVSVLLDGSEFGLTTQPNGLDMVEQSITMGSKALPSSFLLVTLETDNNSVGTINPINISQQDIVYLDVMTTSMGSGSSSANAALLFEGSDVALNTDAEDLDAFTLLASVVNLPPVASNSTVVASEDTPYVFTIGDFNFADQDGGSLAQVRIQTVETAGDLELSGNDVTPGQVVSATEIAAGNLLFTAAPDDNGESYATFEFYVHDGIEYSDNSYTMSIDVTEQADTPSVTPAETNEDTQSSGGLVVTPNGVDGEDVAYFKITAITNGTLFHNDGVTAINPGAFITIAEGGDGLTFTPAANSTATGHFLVQASTASDDSGLGSGGVVAAITIFPVADTPSVTDTSTPEETQTTSGLVISRHAADGPEVTHFKITTITAGTLYHTDGLTVINNGAFISVAQGNAGLKFTPAPGASTNGSFTVQASTSGSDSGLGGGTVLATITVTATNGSPSADIAVASYAVSENIPLDLHGTGLSVADPDAGTNPVRVTLAVGEGVLTVAAGTTGVSVTGSGTSTVSLDGTVSQVNEFLAGSAGATLVYQTLEAQTDSTTLTLTIDDLGHSGSGGPLHATDSATLAVTAINDAPIVTAALAEYAASPNTPLNLQGTGLSVADPDAGVTPVRLTLSVGAGSLSVDPGTIGVTSSGSGTDSVTLEGTLAQLNDLLTGHHGATMTYNPDDAADTILTLELNDLGAHGLGGPLTDLATITITLVTTTTAPINHAPIAINLSGHVIHEKTDTRSGYRVGTLSPEDPDAGDTHTYLVVGGSDIGKFSIGGTSANELMLTHGVLDFETQSSYDVTVRVTDSGGLSYDETLTITVTDLAPAMVAEQSFSVSESASGGIQVGTVATTGDTPKTFSITSGNVGNVFDIDASGVIRINPNTSLDFESTASYTLTIAIGDGTSTVSGTVTITVADVAEAAPAPAPAPAPVAVASPSADTADPDPFEEESLPEPAEEVAARDPVPAPVNPAPVRPRPTPTNRAPNTPSSRNSQQAQPPTRPSPTPPVTSSHRNRRLQPDQTIVTRPAAKHIRPPALPPRVAQRRGLTVGINDEVRDEVIEFDSSEELLMAMGSVDFLRELDELRDDVKDDVAFGQAVIGSTVTVATGLSIGYVLWLLRGGLLLSSLLSSLPAWRFIDPLPVLAHMGTHADEDAADDDSLESVVQQGADRMDAMHGPHHRHDLSKIDHVDDGTEPGGI